MQTTQTFRAAFGLVLGLAVASSAGGCATVTGLVSGAFTGAVDAPTQIYRTHRAGLDANPIYWPVNILVAGPVGFLFGPLAGFAKGIALDVQCMLGQHDYDQVFNSYGDGSVWRPYTIHW